jgi:hypothetical protein
MALSGYSSRSTTRRGTKNTPIRTTRSAVRTGDDVRGTIRTLEAAVRTLGEQLEFANKSLIDERKRVDELLHELADARTAR